MKTIIYIGVFAVLLGLLGNRGKSHAATLSSGQKLVTTFQILPNNPEANFDSEQINGLLSEFYTYQYTQPVGSITASLFNGASLLGTHTTDLSGGDFPFNVFSAFGSQLTFYSPTPTNFGSIRDRTIAGRVEVSIDFGVLEFDLQFYRVNVGRSISQGNGLEFYPGIQQSSFIIPEPTGLIISIAIAALPLVQRKRVVGAKVLTQHGSARLAVRKR